VWDSPHSHSGRDDKYEAPAIKMNQIGASSLEQVSITTYLSQGIFLNSFICSLLSLPAVIKNCGQFSSRCLFV